MTHKVTDRPVQHFAKVVTATGEVSIVEIGDRVRVMTRRPVGHHRVPTYLGGKAGMVEAVIENIFFQKGILAPGELARRMDEVAARRESDSLERAR
jgi:hypothetical protein